MATPPLTRVSQQFSLSSRFTDRIVIPVEDFAGAPLNITSGWIAALHLWIVGTNYSGDNLIPLQSSATLTYNNGNLTVDVPYTTLSVINALPGNYRMILLLTNDGGATYAVGGDHIVQILGDN